MATTKLLAREDGNLVSSLVTSRSRKYKDIDLTFTAKSNGELYKKQDAAAIKQAVKNLIQTNHFEKPFLPFFGGNLRDLLFELAYDDVAEEAEENIKRAVAIYEPRAEVLNVIATANPDSNSISVSVEFKVINTDEIITFTTAVSRLR